MHLPTFGFPLETRVQGTPGAPWTGTTPTMGPLPGILDAPQVAVLGASIMSSTFGTPINAPIQDYATAAGFTGTLVSYAQAGDSIVDTRAKHVTAKSDLAASEGANLYLVHTGGNNVSASRPYPGGEATISAQYDGLMQAITATDAVIPMPLTKRLYGRAGANYPNNPLDVVDGDTASEANGTAPYNAAVIRPAVGTYAPDWLDAQGAPYVNPYEIAARHPEVLQNDGIHGYNRVLARYILARVAGRALGLTRDASRAGKTLVYSIERGPAQNMAIGPVNRFMSNKGFINYPILYGAVFSDGSLDPFVSVRTNDVYQNSTNEDGSLAYPRLADSRFHVATLANNGLYLQPGQTYRLDFYDLTPGDMVTVSACGMRNAGGTARRGEMTLNGGQTRLLDAAKAAASNQVVFDPVPVPADGRLTLAYTPAAGSSYAYLHGVILDFA